MIWMAVFVLGWTLSGRAQDTWSLQRCVEYAAENSLTMQQAELSIRNAELTDRENRLSRLPNFNASVAGGAQLGRTIDPTTNTFNNQTIWFNSYNVSSGMLLYSGGQINNAVEAGKLSLEATRLDAEASFNNMALSIASAYLQVLLAQEQLENAQRQLDLSSDLLDQTDKLIRAGNLPENNRLDALAQVAFNEQTVVQARNAVELNYLTLRQLLELAPDAPFEIERPRIDIPADADPYAYSALGVYEMALGNQPQIQAGDLRQEAAETGIDLAKGNGYPTLSVFANLTSNWSSLGVRQDGFSTVFFPVEVRLPDGTTTTFELGQEIPNLVDDPYFDQLSENFGQSFGLNLRIPIYNASRTSIATQRAQVNALTVKTANDLQKQQLLSAIQQAVASAQASKQSYDAALNARDAASLAYDAAQKRFDLGAMNTFDYTSAKNRLDLAEITLTQAKFQYIFSLKVVDFYLGRPLNLDNN